MRHYKNAWAGFEVEVPDGWEVKIESGMILAGPDPRGFAQAILWPLSLIGPLPAEDVANHAVALARQSYPTFQAWRVPGKDASSLEMSTRYKREGVPMAGSFKVTTGGASALIAGFEGPSTALNALVPAFAQVLASFKPLPALKRLRFQDPVEGGFTAEFPEGFQARGGMQRNMATTMPLLSFEAFEPRLQLHCGVPPSSLTFSEAGMAGFMGMMMGMMPMPGGPPPLAFMPAPVFAEKFVAPRSQHKGARIEKIVDRPDLAPRIAAEWMKAGVAAPPGAFSAAVLDLVFDDQGGRKRERSLVTVARPGMNMWMAQIACTLAAPLEKWDEWEGVLVGIIESVKVNAGWQQGESSKNAAINQARMQDIHRRQLDIANTMRETSDMIVKGHERRQAVQSRSVHDFCNVISGREDRVDSFGTVFNVPAGHDQYWRDGLGNIRGGSWAANPDPSWQRLDPVPYPKL